MKLKSKKSALLLSFTSLLLCFAMLAGSTFAWFTDTATTGVNKIVAGNLHVEIQNKENQKIETLKWVKENGDVIANQEKILWEPGCTYLLTPFKIVNTGNLALKYKIVITGLDGDSPLLNVIKFTYKTASGEEFDVSAEDHLAANGGSTGMITVSAHMDEAADNRYQDKELTNIRFTVYATQDTVENDSYDNQYDKDAAYAQGAYIVGLTDENGKTVTFDTLTAAAKAWRESKDIVTSDSSFGGHPTDLTIDSISWVISGSVKSGDGAGVNGNNNRNGLLLSGGYIYPAVQANSIYVKGVNNAELKNEIVTPSSDALSAAAAKNVVYDGITFPEYMCFNTKAENVTFKNCTFKGGLKVMQAVNVTVDQCKIEGDGTKDYAFFAQGTSLKKIDFKNNTVSGFMRGINVQAEGAAVTISGNTIKNITGKTDGFTYGSAIQLTRGKTFTVTKNTISDVAVNAFHIYNGCAADSIVISDNNISADYLCWNEANYDMNKVTSSGNTLNITNSGKCVTKTEVKDSSFTLN